MADEEYLPGIGASAFESRITWNYSDFAEWVILSSLSFRSGYMRIIRFSLKPGGGGDSVSGAIANCTRAVIVFLLLTHYLNICYLVRGDLGLYFSQEVCYDGQQDKVY